MLSGLVGSAFFSAPAVLAADLSNLYKAPAAATAAPAVDGFNEKFDAFGGSMANLTLYGTEGTLSIPLQGQFGAQLDGRVGSLGGNTFGAGGAHLFWRNPAQGLLGIYADTTEWERFGGVNVTRAAGEGAYYIGPLTLEGVAGVEAGNSVSSATAVPGLGGVTTNTFTQGFNVRTRFFDQVKLQYYFNDNLSGFVGQDYLGGKDALALGAEVAYPLGHGIMSSAFVEARLGEGDFHGVWGGLKFYFGQKDKPLLARQRQDDPSAWSSDSLFSILNNATSGSTTTSNCPPGEVPVDGSCQNPL